MKTSLVLALAGLAAAVPTATSTFNGIWETLPPRPCGVPAVRPYVLHPGSCVSRKESERNAILDFPPQSLIIDTAVQPRADKPVARLDQDLSAFKLNADLSRLASSAPAPYPYTLVFSDQNATAIHQPIETHVLPFYDASECAAQCNEHRACRAFGLFVERQPTCEDCEDPEFFDANVCELYNTRLERRIVTDGERVESVGGVRYTRAVRASNGYNRLRRGEEEGEVRTEWRTVRETQTVTAANKTVTVVDPASIHTVTDTYTAPGSTVTSTHTVHDAATWTTTTTVKETETTTQNSTVTVLGFASPTTTTETATVAVSSTQPLPSSLTTSSPSTSTSPATSTPPAPATSSAPSIPASTGAATAANGNVLTLTNTLTSTRTTLHTLTRPASTKPAPTPAGSETDSESESDSDSDSDSDSEHNAPKPQSLRSVSHGLRRRSASEARDGLSVSKGRNSETESDSDRPGGSDYDDESNEDVFEWLGDITTRVISVFDD